MKYRHIATAYLALATPALAQLAPPSAAEVRADPTIQMFLEDLPPGQTGGVISGVASYSKAAKGWWIEYRCHFAQSMNAGNFHDDLAVLTDSMRMLFRLRLNATAQEADEYTQKIQMYALSEVSGEKFYDCGDRARDVFTKGYAETQRYAAFIKSHPAASKDGAGVP